VRKAEQKHMGIRVLARSVLLGVAVLLSTVSTVQAAVISYTLLDASNNVLARANFSTSTNRLDVQLQNFIVNPASFNQALTDLEFTFSLNQSNGQPFSGALSTTNAQHVRTILGDGSFNVADSPPPGYNFGWSLQNGVNDGLGVGMRLCVLCAGGTGPNALLGEPGAFNLYSNADGTIKGSATDNPFLAGLMSFTLDVPGLTHDAYVDSAFFSFQTAVLQGHCYNNLDVSCQPERRIPEPSTLTLMAAGLIGLAVFAWRARRPTT